MSEGTSFAQPAVEKPIFRSDLTAGLQNKGEWVRLQSGHATQLREGYFTA